MSMRYRSAIVIFLAVSLTVLGSCDRKVTSRDPVRSLPDAPPVPQNLTSLLGDRSITLSWEVSDSAAVALFRVYLLDDPEGEFLPFDSTSSYSKELTDLPLGQVVLLRVTSVTSAGLESLPSASISVTAGLLDMLIENGEAYARARDVYIQVSAPALIAYVEFSEDPDFVGALVREYQPPMPFELSQGDGLKTVFARLTLAEGNTSPIVLTDQIILDTEARIDSVWFTPRGITFEVGDTVFFYLRAGGEINGGAQVSFPSVSRVLLRDTGTGGDQTPADGTYSARWIVPVGLTVDQGEVTGAFIDAAGNSAPSAQAPQLLNVRTATIPTPVILAVGLADSTTAHLSWTLNEDDDFGSYRVYRSAIDAEIQADDDHLVVGVITSQATTEYDEFLAGSGIYWYKVFVFDTEGLGAGSNQVAITR